jgi:hypothetical protein
LFLYQVTENAFLKNQDRRASPGAYGSPPLSLNAHYLITAYGATQEATSMFVNESQAQQLLGSAMRVLNDFPVITDSLVTVRNPVGQMILHDSLRRAYEKIKICLDPLSLEDLTKIWTSLTIPYRLSAAYSISVVQIESRRARRFPQLVGEPLTAGPMITVVPLQTPYIASLAVIRQGDPEQGERSTPYARIGDTLVIKGEHFSGGTVNVAIGGLQIPVIPVSNKRIELILPDDQFAWNGANVAIPAEARLQPGVQTVEVVTTPPGLPNAPARSNQAIMMLTPHIQSITGTAPSTLTITGTRLFAPDLECETLVGQVLFMADAYTAASSTSITVTLPAMAQIGAPGVYPVRVRVNGAESIGGANSIGLPLP